MTLYSNFLLLNTSKCLVLFLTSSSCSVLSHFSHGVSLPHSSVQGILQARMVDWVAMSTSKGIFPTEGLNSCLLGFLLWQMGSLSLTPQNICYNKQMVTIFTRITISSSKLTHKQAALDTTVHFKMSDTNFQKKKLKLFFLMFYVAFYN